MLSNEIQYLPTKVGEGTILLRGYLLHSKYDPIKEAARIVDKQIHKYGVNIIFGYGKGYIAKALLNKNFDKEKILFIEPMGEFQQFDDGAYDVIYGTDKEKIYEAIQKKLTFFSKKIYATFLPNYDKIFPELYRDILASITEIQNVNTIYSNTANIYSNNWQENTIRNTLYTYQNHSLEELEKKYDCPVVIASGGPSLSKQIPLLREIYPHIILIASGSTIDTLMAHDIEPHYVVSVDGSQGNYRKHFKDLKTKNTELIYSLTSYYKIQQGFNGEQFAMANQAEVKLMAQLFLKYGISLPMIRGGGSVAVFAMSVAAYLTTGKIAMIGQDLAYTNNLTHADGNANKKEVGQDFYAKQGAFETEGYYGDKVITDYTLFTMKQNIEAVIVATEEKDSIYNCTEGGIKINEMQQLPFKVFCQSFVTKDATVTMKKVTSKHRPIEEYVAILRKELRIYNEMLVEYKNAIRTLDRNTSKTEFSQAILKELDTIDAKVDKLKLQVNFDQIENPIKLAFMNDYEQFREETAEETYFRVFTQNRMLYTELVKAVELTMGYTKEAITEAETIMEAETE